MTQGKMSNVGVWRQRFYYADDEDMEIGALVRLSDDMTVSAVKAAGGAVGFFSAGADSPIGICEENRVAAMSNLGGTDMIMVRMFGHFKEERAETAIGAVTAGDLITLRSGAKAFALTSGGQGDEVIVLV